MPPLAEEPMDIGSNADELTKILDAKSDTNGLKNINDDGEDWTDAKHSERKKRDRVLDDGVLLKLIQKSDYEGFKRLFENLAIMGFTAYGIYLLEVFPVDLGRLSVEKILLFLPLYFFYGFQFQCFAFAGQHEFLHRNAWKTKKINDWALFLTGVVCFEFGKHERVMHKQHHTFTNNIYKDPELTSYYSREQLECPTFRNVPFSRWGYFKMFWDILFTFKCRVGRLLMSSLGVPVDYSGFGWSLKEWSYSRESGIMDDLKRSAQLQLSIYAVVFGTIGRTREGCTALLFWWIVPVLIGYPFVNFFRNLEHADCEITNEINNAIKNTRSVRSNFIIRQLLWNTNFHAEHHCYPMVPFFNLPKVSELMDPHLEHNECRHFTSQNLACLKKGGWIDQQSKVCEK